MMLVCIVLVSVCSAANSKQKVTDAPFGFSTDPLTGDPILISLDMRYVISDFKLRDTFNGRTITNARELIEAKQYIDLDKWGPKEVDVDTSTFVTYSTNPDSDDVLLFVDPFQEESFDLLSRVVEASKSTQLDYAIVLVPTSEFSAKKLKHIFCGLNAKGHQALTDFVAGKKASRECRDFRTFALGMQMGLAITSGQIPMAISNDIALIRDDLSDLRRVFKGTDL